MSVRGRDFLTMQEYSVDELQLLLTTARELKRDFLIGVTKKVLPSKVLAMIF